MKRARIAISIAAVCVLAGPPIAAGGATPNDQATCVGLASAFFGQQAIRDDVAHVIAERFGIPPGAEVSRLAHVQLGDTAACIANGQG
jgi:uncharacterized lipoprotein YbaY